MCMSVILPVSDADIYYSSLKKNINTMCWDKCVGVFNRIKLYFYWVHVTELWRTI